LLLLLLALLLQVGMLYMVILLQLEQVQLLFLH
jgi:hypothetical protein